MHYDCQAQTTILSGTNGGENNKLAIATVSQRWHTDKYKKVEFDQGFFYVFQSTSQEMAATFICRLLISVLSGKRTFGFQYRASKGTEIGTYFKS